MQKRRGGFSLLTLKKRAKKNTWQGEEESSRPHVRCTEWICPHIPKANLGRSQQEHLYNLFWGSLSVEIYLLEIQKIRNAFFFFWISIPGYSVLIFTVTAIVFTNDVYQNNPQLLSLCLSICLNVFLSPPSSSTYKITDTFFSLPLRSLNAVQKMAVTGCCLYRQRLPSRRKRTLVRTDAI